MASLLLLPDELLCHIVYYLTGIQLFFKQHESRYLQPNQCFVYLSNRHRLGNHVSDILNLSLTCYRFRELLGVALFGFISLRRSSEIDSILSYPRRMDRWSDSDRLSREFDDLILASVRSVGISNFVNDLEISNCYLDKLLLFRNLHTLKVLDTPFLGKVFNTGLNVTRLSINAETLLHFDDHFPNMYHLDLVTDIHALEPQSLGELAKFGSNLNSLNLFVTDTNVLLSAEMLAFFLSILRNGNLKNVAVRAIRKIGQRAPLKQWELASNSGPSFINSLQSLSLATVMIDYEFLRNLEFPVTQNNHSLNPLACFTLVDPVLSLLKLDHVQLKHLAQVVEGFRPREFALAYGEVIIQSHFQAFGAVQTFLGIIPPNLVTVISLEKAWSVADDSLVRKYYEDLIDTYDRTDQLKVQRVADVSFTESFLFSTPSFRNREYFQVRYDGEMAFVPCDFSMGTANRLWDIESSLRDLEHYCIREKKLSSIWD